MLRDFTVAVLRTRPEDLYQFASEYFNKTSSSRPGHQSTSPGHVTTSTAGPTAAAAATNCTLNGTSTMSEGVDADDREAEAVAKSKVPMYIVVDDDEEAREPDKSELKPKTTRQHRYGRRPSVSAERYDPEADDDTDENKVNALLRSVL